MYVWHDNKSKWIEYTLEELDEYFKFVSKPNWNKVRELYLFNSGFNTWLRVVFKNGSSKDYNNVYGTFKE